MDTEVSVDQKWTKAMNDAAAKRGLDIRFAYARFAVQPDFCIDALLDAVAKAPAPTEMRLCELNHLMLHPNQTYVFTVDETCASCKKYAAESDPFGYKVKA